MTKLDRLHADLGRSPWLDNINRRYLRDGTLTRLVAEGIRGVIANPMIVARAISGSADYDEPLASSIADGYSVEASYWKLAITDIEDALRVLRPVFDAGGGNDGFVSLEVAPELADDASATIAAARHLYTRIDAPNLLVKIPATAAGVVAIEAMIAEGRNINVTLIFSLTRYAEVVEAYPAGLETFITAGGDPSTMHSVASFFVSRVDSEVDPRFEALGDADAPELRGRAGVAQAKLAYLLFRDRFAGARWGEPSTPAVGIDLDEGPGVSRHHVRRQPHRA